MYGCVQLPTCVFSIVCIHQIAYCIDMNTFSYNFAFTERYVHPFNIYTYADTV